MNRISFIVLVFLLYFCATMPAVAADINEKYYRVIYHDIARTNSGLGADWIDWTAKAILYYSAKHGVNPLLDAANFKQESSYSMRAHSSTGAIGIAQLMPGTARALGVDPYIPNQNIEGGIIYLAQNLKTFQGAGQWQASFAIAAYNAGPEAIKKYGGIPPYEETINHVRIVVSDKSSSPIAKSLKRLQ